MTPERLVREWLDGWNKRNFDRIMSQHRDDAVFASRALNHLNLEFTWAAA